MRDQQLYHPFARDAPAPCLSSFCEKQHYLRGRLIGALKGIGIMKTVDIVNIGSGSLASGICGQEQEVRPASSLGHHSGGSYCTQQKRGAIGRTRTGIGSKVCRGGASRSFLVGF